MNDSISGKHKCTDKPRETRGKHQFDERPIRHGDKNGSHDEQRQQTREKRPRHGFILRTRFDTKCIEKGTIDDASKRAREKKTHTHTRIRMSTCLGVPREAVLVGQDPRSDSAPVVSPETHQHHADLGHLGLGLEVERLADRSHHIALYERRLFFSKPVPIVVVSRSTQKRGGVERENNEIINKREKYQSWYL